MVNEAITVLPPLRAALLAKLGPRADHHRLEDLLMTLHILGKSCRSRTGTPYTPQAPARQRDFNVARTHGEGWRANFKSEAVGIQHSNIRVR